MALQRWNKQVTGALTTSGMLVYTFPAIPEGFNALISVSVPGASAGSGWEVLISGNLTSTIYGANPCGPLWLSGGDVVTITSTLAIPGTTTGFNLPIATLEPGNAVSVGAIGLQGELPPSSLVTAGGIPAGLAFANINVAPTSAITPAITISGNARGILVISNMMPELEPFGPFLPVDWPAMGIQYGTPAVGGTWWASTGGAGSVTLDFGTIPSFYIVLEVDYDFDFVEACRALGAWTVTVSSPAPGANWTYTLPGPARLVALAANYQASVAAANRYPFFFLTNGSVNIAYSPGPTTAQTATDLWSYSVYPGAPNVTSVGAGISLAPLPDIFMPAGYVIGGYQSGMPVGDQWSAIELVLSPI